MSDTLKILVINPGGTSTKIAAFENGSKLFLEDVRHSSDELSNFKTVLEQNSWRLDLVRKKVAEHNMSMESFDAIVGRGGPVVPVPSGTYIIDEPMLDAIFSGRVMIDHPSLLGATIAFELAQTAGCPAFIVDPVCVDEFIDEARLTGLPQIPRRALSHTLSVKAAARKAALELGLDFYKSNFVVLHLGSGFTVAVQKNGRQIDATDASASGPMSPTRAGSMPALDMAVFCLSQKKTLAEMKKLLVGGSGWMAHLGTDDVREIYKRIDNNDSKAKLVLDATLLQLAKETAGMFSVLKGEVNAIILTGGVTRSQRFTEALKTRLAWLKTSVIVQSGENEMSALARGAVRAVNKNPAARSMEPYIEKN